MLHKAKKLLRNNDGMSYITVVCMLLAFIMVFSVVLTFASTVMYIREQQESAKLTLDNFITENSTDIRGVFSRYLIRGKAVLNSMDTTSFTENLIVSNGLTEEGGYLVKYGSKGEVKYYITYPVISYVEPERKTLYLYADYDIYVPLRMSGRVVTQASVHTRVRSFFQGKIADTTAAVTMDEP